ncbi:rhodanese-like domain-containing protein [Mesobacterium sp. TK19101]|uniref:Rhodanese-like domain-containing protein n=1 Tax=Mesobacterium hydrothermale TaxID=3111907 RepID=A0ABU6HHR0_9RHOB|nr:rhodanese-like domain-containing protein [Mesobacterium sp. TK19101]MEC3861901.1 rhodanese-like domain-containing protein [Mesobacterium sp. TK19101]
MIPAPKIALAGVLVAASLAAAPVLAQDDAVAEAVIDYMDFATYEAGIILPNQIDQTVFDAATFIDTRDAEQFGKDTIPGAVNIEWREIPGRLDEIPDSGLVILFCNTGSLSAQATFAARLMGRENVVVLQSGINGWHQDSAYKP